MSEQATDHDGGRRGGPETGPSGRPETTPARPRSGGGDGSPERGGRGAGSGGPSASPGSSLVWWIPLLVLLAWFGFFRPMTAPDRVELSYSEFQRQVADGRVERVSIEGDVVRGRFSRPYVPPEDSDASGADGDPSGAGTDSAGDGSDAEEASFDAFRTVTPPFAGESLGEMLATHDVEVRAESMRESRWMQLALAFLPLLLIVALFWWGSRALRQRMEGMQGGGGPFGVGRSRAKRFERSQVDTDFDQVAGAENAKRDLRQVIDFLRDPERYRGLGAKLPRGLLLMGAPGTGKTLLARAVAGEAGVPFFSISGSEFIETFVGVGAARVRNMFEEATEAAPSVVFIDEIDSIGRSRGAGVGGGHDEREQTLNQILNEMDGFSGREAVVVIAATNRPDVLDPALLRPGRFDRKINLELPHREARRAILGVHTRNVPLDDDVDLDAVAAATTTFSGADLENLVNEAALLAGRDRAKRVTADHFDRARDVIVLGHPRESMMDERERRRVAWHEAGHALLAATLPEADALRKVTIVPRGHALGATEQVPDEARLNRSRSFFLDRLAVMLGGRCAERVAYEEVSSGAAEDLRQATALARRMVTEFGMSERLGAASFRYGEEHVFLGKELAQPRNFSEHTAQLIDAEIQEIVAEAEKRALRILEERSEVLDAIAESLLDRETLEKEEVEALIQRDGPPASEDEPGGEA